MTLDEISKAMSQRTIVTYNGGRYIISGVITRFGRMPKMKYDVPDGWWYQIELLDIGAEGYSVCIVGPEDIEVEKKE
ncbi:MAG: hypothetical protein ACI396_02495 [Acutalibacteraceae bacterium]